MPLTEGALDEVRARRTDVVEPVDLDGFWQRTIHEARDRGAPAEFLATDSILTTIESSDVTFTGFGGEPIRGWMHRPRGVAGPLPCVVQYIGYGMGRGFVHQNVLWAAAGFAHFVMDTRGQGARGGVGATADPNSGFPEVPGVLTRGVADPESYYYRRVFTDAVRAIDAVQAHPGVDSDRIAVAGGSQGGAISIAAAALSDVVRCAAVDVPFLCDVRRAVHLSTTRPYQELAQYLQNHRDKVEQTFATLAHFDGAVLAGRASVPALFSVGLMDEICPPSTVYSAYNAWRGDKQIAEFEFNNHEGGGLFHADRQVQWVREVMGC